MCQKYNNLLCEFQKQLDKRDFWGCTMVTGWLWFIENYVNDGCPQIGIAIPKTALMEGLTDFRNAWFMWKYCNFFTKKKSIEVLLDIMQMFKNITDEFYRRNLWDYDVVSLDDITCADCPGCVFCTDLARLFRKETYIRVEHMKKVVDDMISASTSDSEKEKLQCLKDNVSSFQVSMMTNYGTCDD